MTEQFICPHCANTIRVKALCDPFTIDCVNFIVVEKVGESDAIGTPELHIEIARLKSLLERYARHSHDCPCDDDNPSGAGKCTCGFSEAIHDRRGDQ